MNNIFSRTFFRRPAKKETGFTLIEIVIAMGIVSTLSAIAVPVGMKAHREAVIATVKSDVRSSVDTIMGENGFSEESFMAGKAVTAGNNLTLTIDGQGADAVACVWGSHAFGENDVVSFYYSSATGRLNEGTCLGAGTSVLTGVGETTGDAVDAIVDNTSGGVTTTSVTEPVALIPSATVATTTNAGVANACSTLSTTLSSIATERNTEHHDHNHDGKIDDHDDTNHDGRVDEHDHDDERDHNHDGKVDHDDDTNHDGKYDEHDHDDWDYNHDGRVDDDDDENHDGHVDGHEHEHGTVTGTVTSNLCGVIVNAQENSTRHDDDDDDEHESDHHEDSDHSDDDAIQKAANESNVKKFPVCHSVSSGKYKLLMLPITSVTNASWSSGTIIPPITGKYNGKNWDNSGQKTFLKNCA